MDNPTDNLLNAVSLLESWLSSDRFNPHEIVGRDEYDHPLNKAGLLRKYTRDFIKSLKSGGFIDVPNQEDK